jgi:NADH:ubiquinone oxidoreductase subunit 5 (subunit L)/multisubunit Na+/H+ antiporter MnhA subunit
MLINRIGDVGLALGISLIFVTFKTIDYGIVFGLIPVIVNDVFFFAGFSVHKLTLVALLIL